MKQRRKWPTELSAAIGAADAEGIAPNRIRKLAKTGELDGITQPFDVPESTFFYILARERAARIASVDPIQPGDEEREAGAILRRALEIAKRELAKVDAALSDPRKTANERDALTKQLDKLSRMARGYEAKATNASRSTSQQRAGQASANRKADPLAELVRAKERELASDNGHGDG